MKGFVPVWRCNDAVKEQENLRKRIKDLEESRDRYRELFFTLSDVASMHACELENAKNSLGKAVAKANSLEKQLAESTQRRIELAQMYDELMVKYKAAVEGGEKE